MKSRERTLSPKEHIPRVDLRISQVNAIRLNTKENLCQQKFPLRSQQRPKSVKNNEQNLSRGSTSSIKGSTKGSSRVFIRESSSGTRRSQSSLDDPQELRKFFKENSFTKRRETASSKKDKDTMEEYVKNYARVKHENQNFLVKLPILSFSPEVVNERSEAHLQTYQGTNPRLFKYKKHKNKPKKLKPIGLISRHEACIPRKKYDIFPRQIPQYLYNDKVQSDEPDFIDIPSTTAFWEQYVLSLVSKNTAQWIANRCTTGNKRDHLIQFLDEMYEIDYYEDSADKTRKLLDNDDDCISKDIIKPAVL